MSFECSSNNLRTVGFVFLILASLSKWFLQRTGVVGPDLADGITGMFYGITIASLLLSMRINRRRSA
jgi:hypothetical protein